MLSTATPVSATALPDRKLGLSQILLVASLLLSAIFAGGCAVIVPQRYSSFTAPAPLPRDSWLIIGILGSAESWDSNIRPVRKLALDLRAQDLPGVHVETVENHRRSLAMKLVEKALDRNGDGTLDPSECSAARIILYGHSFGGAAVLKLARELKTRGIPVVLTVQVDSIGMDRSAVPANVARAVNFYQRDSMLLRGSRIHAEDPARTAILGNFQIETDGRKTEVPHSGLHWMEAFFGGAHSKLEFDPDVWQRVEQYILAEIRPAELHSSPGLSGNPPQSEPPPR